MKKLTIVLTFLAMATAVAILLAGAGCGTKSVEFTGLDGANGASGVNGTDGVDGVDGAPGAPGADGYNALITFTRLQSEVEVCKSGSGFLFASGLDLNRNGTLDTEEIIESSIAVVCDGAAGEQGPQGEVGPAGRDGVDGENGQDGTPGEPGAPGETGPEGPQGPAGDQGPVGPAGDGGATLTSFTLTTTCVSIGEGLFASKTSSNVAEIFNDHECHTGDRVAQLSKGSDEVFMAGNVMFIVDGSLKLYKVTF